MKKLMQLTFRSLLIVAAMFIAPLNAAAQNEISVEVTVTDDLGPVFGASVFVEGTTIGDVTNENGVTVINNVPKNGTLVVSFIGYATQTIKVEGRAKINVKMAVSSEFIEETVVVGYGVQKKESLTSAISQIASEDIENTKQIDVVSSLQGKIPGLLITQNNSRPGDFNSTISLRGYGTPMVVVDGVVRSGGQNFRSGWGGNATLSNDLSVLQELDANDIESISVLKDASAAIYGLGAANGVILITTKKGKIQKPSVSFNANLSLQQPTSIQDKVPLQEYLRWKNGMIDVAREAGKWSEDDIQKFASGANEWYDWYDNLTKNVAFTKNFNLSVRGGSEQIQYYLGLGYADDATVYKTQGFNYDRYNINGNVTAKITKDLEARFQTSMRITNTKQPGSYNDLANLTYYLYMCDPTTKPYVKDNPSHFTSVEEHKNPAAILSTDHELTTRRSTSFNNTLDLTYTAPFLKGLKLQATGAYDYNVFHNSQMIHQWDEYDYWTDEWAGIGCGNNDDWKQQDTYSENWMYNTRLYGRIQANYANRFGKHDIQAMLAAETTIQKRYNIGGSREYGPSAAESFFTHPVLNMGYAPSQKNNGTRSASATAGYLGRINYNYAGKYFVEFMGRYDGTYVYAPGKRWGFFPSYSLGWRISEENFGKDNIPWLNNLKVRWSDGFTGMVKGSAYAYLAGYTQSGSWAFTEGKSVAGWSNSTVENTVLTWTNVRMMDVGVDWEISRGIFGGSFDWFRRITSGIAAQRSATIPDFYGVTLPQENLNKQENQGLELQLYHRNTVGNFTYRIQASATYTRNRMLYQESDKTAKYSSAYNYWSNHTTGRWNGYNSFTAYHANGQYTNLNEIADANVMNSRLNGNAFITPGQYIVDDRNGDGYINSSDVYYYMSADNPPLQYGLQFSGNWKNLDFSIVFNGSALRWKTIGMYGYSGTGFFEYMPSMYKDSYHVANYGDDPWDPKTQWVAGYYPALQAAGAVYNTGSPDGTYTLNLPYNTVNAAFLRLKTVDVGYTVSPNFLKVVGIKSCRLSFNATNLLTICDRRLKFSDPEQVDNEGGAGVLPPNRAYTFGIRLNF